MKKLLLLLIGLAIASTASAQFAKWVIAPNYERIDTIVNPDGNTLIVTDSLSYRILWSLDGKRLYSTNNEINPFHQDRAVITKRGTQQVVGMIDGQGKFTALPEGQVAYDQPYFTDGYMPHYTADGLRYYTLDGRVAEFDYNKIAFPFSHGYAPYITYDNIEKGKAPYWRFYTAPDKSVVYMLDSKPFNPVDVKFLSSIAPDGRGIAVIKNKLYWFNSETGMFEPMLYGDEPKDKDRHLQLDIADETILTSFTQAAEFYLNARYGKKDKKYAYIEFDGNLVPRRIVWDENNFEDFPTAEPKTFSLPSNLQVVLENGLYRIDRMGELALPAQFKEVSLTYDDRAFATSPRNPGRWGLLEVIPDMPFSVKINNGDPIPFRHKKFNTMVRVDMPAECSYRLARLDMPEEAGVMLDKTSMKGNGNEYGNFLTYDCTLLIPSFLPDYNVRYTYPYSISFDGIKTYPREVEVEGWHFKSYNVDEMPSETTVKGGVASVTMNVTMKSTLTDGDYPFTVRAMGDSLDIVTDKLSETRFKFTVKNLQEGENQFNILIDEEGCPPSVFPFEIVYTKPEPKKKKQEGVSVHKKPTQQQPAQTLPPGPAVII